MNTFKTARIATQDDLELLRDELQAVMQTIGTLGDRVDALLEVTPAKTIVSDQKPGHTH